MTKIRAAIRVGLPPTIMWNVARTDWDEKALLLLHAHQVYEDSLCKGCGQSGLHALDVANTRAFAVGSVTCLGCNVREIYEENHGKDKTKGEKVYVTNHMGMGGDEDG